MIQVKEAREKYYIDVNERTKKIKINLVFTKEKGTIGHYFYIKRLFNGTLKKPDGSVYLTCLLDSTTSQIELERSPYFTLDAFVFSHFDGDDEYYTPRSDLFVMGDGILRVRGVRKNKNGEYFMQFFGKAKYIGGIIEVIPLDFSTSDEITIPMDVELQDFRTPYIYVYHDWSEIK